MVETRLLVAEQVQRTIRRLAYEILERNRGSENLTVLGILDSGAKLGTLLASVISSVEEVDVPCHALDVRPFRDDLEASRTDSPRSTSAASGAASPDLDIEDRDVILVDDVLYTGRTARAALDAVVRFGRPRSIQFTVLIDRGHREYPIQPDFVGRRIPTRHQERVEVTLGDDPCVLVQA